MCWVGMAANSAGICSISSMELIVHAHTIKELNFFVLIRSILEKVADHTSQGVDTPPPEDEDDDSELPLSQPRKKAAREEEEEGEGEERKPFRVCTEEISIEELSRECIISLTSPQNNPQWLRDELRQQGALDRLANMGEPGQGRRSKVKVYCFFFFFFFSDI